MGICQRRTWCKLEQECIEKSGIRRKRLPDLEDENGCRLEKSGGGNLVGGFGDGKIVLYVVIARGSIPHRIHPSE